MIKDFEKWRSGEILRPLQLIKESEEERDEFFKFFSKDLLESLNQLPDKISFEKIQGILSKSKDSKEFISLINQDLSKIFREKIKLTVENTVKELSENEKILSEIKKLIAFDSKSMNKEIENLSSLEQFFSKTFPKNLLNLLNETLLPILGKITKDPENSVEEFNNQIQKLPTFKEFSSIENKLKREIIGKVEILKISKLFGGPNSTIHFSQDLFLKLMKITLKDTGIIFKDSWIVFLPGISPILEIISIVVGFVTVYRTINLTIQNFSS